MICAHCKRHFDPPPWPATKTRYCSNRIAGSCGVRAYLDKHRERLNKISRWRTKHKTASVRAAKRKWNNSERGQVIRRAWQLDHWEETYTKIKAAGGVSRIYARQKSRKILLRSGRPIICKLNGEHRGRIECHHRDENPFNMKLSNLVWICVGHHRAHHRKPIHQRNRT